MGVQGRGKQEDDEEFLEDHQQRYGIVTADGQIIDGNCRANLFKGFGVMIVSPRTLTAYQFFEAIILPIDADRKEILRLETTYQMGEDAKVDYGLIEKYLKAADLANEGFSTNQIANFMGVKPAEIKMYLDVLKRWMNIWMPMAHRIYTVLDTREESFQKLDSALRGYAAGGVSKMWGYNVEADVSDLKSIAFDYIRLGLDQQDFRDIIRKPSKNSTDASFFSNEEIWRQFSDVHFETVEGINEKSVDDIIKEHPGADVGRLLRARDNEWKNSIGELLYENFQRSGDKLNNKQQAAEPIKLLQKAWEAISAVDTSQDSFREDPRVKEYLGDIGKKVKEYGEILL